MITPHTANTENSTNANILEAELFFIIIRYCEKHFFSMSNNNFCDAFEAALNVHQSVKNIVEFAIAEVVRKNFTANMSSKNTPVQELWSEMGVGAYLSKGTYSVKYSQLLFISHPCEDISSIDTSYI